MSERGAMASAAPTPRDDFIWSWEESPHNERRLEILKKHPEIRSLMGIAPSTKYYVLAIVALQFGIAWALRAHDSYRTWQFWAAAYVIGGTACHALLATVHETTHGLLFKRPLHNQLFAIFVANSPFPVPFAMSFAQYHLDHHKHLGVDGLDPDLPTKWEAQAFRTPLGKAFISLFFVFFYTLRPLTRNPKPLTRLHIVNAVYIFALHAALWRTVGPGVVAYLAASMFFSLSLFHPSASHLVTEHYCVVQDSIGTDSYYGPLNWVWFNTGYHVEHHDFPNIAWPRLPVLRDVAREFYDAEPFKGTGPLGLFIFGPGRSLFSRFKRINRRATAAVST